MNYVANFLIDVLAVFRLTELFTVDDGPYNMFTRFRLWCLKNAHKNETMQTISDGVHCPYCMSVWLSFIIMLLPKKLRYIFGIAGAVSLVKTLQNKIEGEF